MSIVSTRHDVRARSAARSESARTGAVHLLNALLICGILSPAVYVGADVAAARLYAGYSYADQAVSELFAIGAPTSRLVVTLFSLSSVLGLAFAVGVWRSDHRGLSRRLLAATLALSAINALVLWNVFPMHMRGAVRTGTDTMHLVLAANPYWLLSLIFGSVAFRGKFRTYSIVTIVVLLALAAYGFSYAPAVAANGATPWMGLSERAAQYAHGAWQASLAVALWRERIEAL